MSHQEHNLLGPPGRRRGFTLMELMVVVVIVAILATLAVTRYISLKDKSMVAAATYDLDLLRKMLAYYSVDYGQFPPAAASYNDLKNQMVDPDGNPYGRLPLSNTYTWISYALDATGSFVILVQVSDHNHTVLVVTPDRVAPL